MRNHPIALALGIAWGFSHAALAQEFNTTTNKIPAQSQSAHDDAILPEVRVTATGESATGPVIGYRATHSATATKTDTALNEVPHSVSVITGDQIKDQNAQTMQEVLRYTAGVRSDVYGLDNRGDWFDLRGGSQGSTLLDGLRLPLTGWYGVVRNEPYAFERVEVLRGPASVIAGQNGPGGVVNMVSKRPQAEAQHEISVQLGNNHHKQIAADLTGPLDSDGALLYRLVATGKESGTQVKYADEERQYFAPSLTWRPSAATSVTAYMQYQRDRSRNTEGFFPVAGTLHPAPNGYIPDDTFVGEPDWDIYGGKRVRIGYQLEHQLNDVWRVRHNLRYDSVRGKLRSMYANFWEVDPEGRGYGSNALGANRTIGRTWYATDDEGRIANTDLLAEGKLKLGAVQHTILVGVDAMYSINSQKQLSGAARPLDVYAPVYGSFPLPALAFGEASKTRVRQLGLIAQDQIKFGDRWVLMTGLRHDHAKTTVSDSPNGGSDDSALSKNLGLVFLGNGGWSPYFSYAESFQAVGGVDKRNNAAYQPKRGKQFEAGVKWSPPGTRFAASAAVYKLKEKNRLSTDPLNPNNQIQGGEVTVQGLEIETTANLRAWDLVANYTYTDAKVTASSDPNDAALNKFLPNVARHSAALWAVHKFGVHGLPGLKAGMGVRYVGKTWDGTDTLATPSSKLVDAMVSWDRGDWRYAFNVSNLFDKTYFAACLERGDCWYGTRRKAMATIAYRW
jgi:iron complex outermembrane receptor protein